MPFRQEDQSENKEEIKREEMKQVETRGSKRPPWERPLLATEEEKQYFARGYLYERRIRGLPCSPVPKQPEEPPPKYLRNYYTRKDTQ